MQGMEGMIWRVGCYKINPTTPSGQKFFILHMLVLPLIPITALVIQNGKIILAGPDYWEFDCAAQELP